MSKVDRGTEEAPERGAAPDVGELLGAPVQTAFDRYGRAVADRMAGEDRWLRFEGPGWDLRLRARAAADGGTPCVRSWTATFARGFDTVSEARHALGLPAAERPTPGIGVEERRQPLRDGRGRVHSLTAAVRDGRVRAVSGFDEPPDWPSDS